MSLRHYVSVKDEACAMYSCSNLVDHYYPVDYPRPLVALIPPDVCLSH